MEKAEAPPLLESYLGLMVRLDASDLFLTTGRPPAARIHGRSGASTSPRSRPRRSTRCWSG